jgi:hypothetical protein
VTDFPSDNNRDRIVRPEPLMSSDSASVDQGLGLHVFTASARMTDASGERMTLLRGEVQGYDVDRMIVQFTMINDGRVVQCAVSSAAMDAIEGAGDVKPDQRVDQFVRLRDVIEERATRRFLESTPPSNRPLILRSNDF